jgi:nucleoside diphosphate kinase
MEQSAVLVKPDAIRRGLVPALKTIIRSVGLQIIDEVEIQLDANLVLQFQPFLKNSTEIGDEVKQAIIDSLCEMPVLILLIGGDNAIEATREVKVRFRRQFGPPGNDLYSRAVHNLVHAPDNQEEFELLKEALLPRN